MLNHHVVRVSLANGSVLEISAGHPTADGRRFADLAPGSLLDGIAVCDVHEVPYLFPYTYDLLPDTDTGVYFAGGARVGNTLRPTPFQ